MGTNRHVHKTYQLLLFILISRDSTCMRHCAVSRPTSSRCSSASMHVSQSLPLRPMSTALAFEDLRRTNPTCMSWVNRGSLSVSLAQSSISKLSNQDDISVRVPEQRASGGDGDDATLASTDSYICLHAMPSPCSAFPVTVDGRVQSSLVSRLCPKLSIVTAIPNSAEFTTRLLTGAVMRAMRIVYIDGWCRARSVTSLPWYAYFLARTWLNKSLSRRIRGAEQGGVLARATSRSMLSTADSRGHRPPRAPMSTHCYLGPRDAREYSARKAGCLQQSLALPLRSDVRERQRILRRLVLSDAEAQVKQFARSLPLSWSEAVQKQMDSLQSRFPLVQWHFKWQSPMQYSSWPAFAGWSPNGSAQPSRTGGRAPSRVDAERAKAAELRGALRKAASPAVISLVGRASRARPSAAPRLSRRVAVTALALATWQWGRTLRTSPRTRYSMMNAFLKELTQTLDECHAILETSEQRSRKLLRKSRRMPRTQGRRV